jgi:diacylglycerol kinase family enzyme
LNKVGLEHADIRELDHEHGSEQLSEIEKEAPDLLISWGGDGTQRAVLDRLGRHSSKILLLPGGTMNLLSKWLHGQHPWETVLWSVLASPQPRVLPAGKVGNNLFFCALLAGVAARFADAREDVRRGDFGRALQDTGAALDSVRKTHLATSFGDDSQHADHHFPSGNVVGALVGPLAANGRMEVVRSSLPSAISAIEFAWSTFTAGWRQRPDISIEPADVLIVENADGGDIPAIIDGEHIQAGSSLTVNFVEEAAACLVAGATA